MQRNGGCVRPVGFGARPGVRSVESHKAATLDKLHAGLVCGRRISERGQ